MEESEAGMQSQTSKSKLLRMPSFGLTVVPPQQSAAKAHSALSSMTPTGSVTSDSDSDSCFDSWSSTTGDFTSESESESDSGSGSDDEGSGGSAGACASNMRSQSLADMGPSGSAAAGGDTGPATPTSVEHLPFSRPESPVYVPGGAGAAPGGEHLVPGSTRLSTADSDSAPYSAWSSSEDSDSEDGSLPRITARPRASSTIQPDQALQEPLFARYLVQHWEREDDLAAAAAARAAAGASDTAEAAGAGAGAAAAPGSRPKIPVMGECEAKSPALMLRKDLRRERHNSTNTCLVNNVIPAPIIEDLVHWFVTLPIPSHPAILTDYFHFFLLQCVVCDSGTRQARGDRGAHVLRSL